jgi:hypothetical protein
MRKATLAFLLLLTTSALADDFAYVFDRGGRALINGNMNLDAVTATRKRFDGNFLWVKRNGHEYVIRDAATLAEARAAFREADKIHQGEYEPLLAKMRPLEERERELDRQIDHLSEDLSEHGEGLSDADRQVKAARVRELRDELKPLRRELRRMEREEARLDALEDPLVARAEQTLRQIVDRAIARGTAERVR